MDVKYIDFEKIRSKKMELEKYPGYLPGLIETCIDRRDWMDFLEKEGLLTRELENKIFDRHMSFQEEKEELIQWCEENPQYADFIIWEED
ncbi:hypothetical protein [Methanobrevibacter sp.]|uniref:hypothetical protein n=1 Tax=Methanobrevibacter sp. TaxID=66852 RepID=UPI001B274217|nr:hypothetical protein [Methanobrevibacter sp.]